MRSQRNRNSRRQFWLMPLLRGEDISVVAQAISSSCSALAAIPIAMLLLDG